MSVPKDAADVSRNIPPHEVRNLIPFIGGICHGGLFRWQGLLYCTADMPPYGMVPEAMWVCVERSTSSFSVLLAWAFAISIIHCPDCGRITYAFHRVHIEALREAGK